MSKKALPNLIIAGVPRSGTTSLFFYLSQHPDIYASKIKEIGYFVPIHYGRNPLALDEYLKYFKNYRQQKYIMEGSVGYFYGGEELAKEIYHKLGRIKLIFIFREPTQQLFSFFRYLKNKMMLPRNFTFHQYVELSKKAIKKNEAHKKKKDFLLNGIRHGFYINYLEGWYKYFEGLVKILFFEKLKENPFFLMNDLCEWLDIDPFIYRGNKFTVENRSFLYKNAELQKKALIINKKLEYFFRKYPSIKIFLRQIYYFINESSEKEDIKNITRKHLKAIYDPYNKKLFEFFSSKNFSNLPKWLVEYGTS